VGLALAGAGIVATLGLDQVTMALLGNVSKISDRLKPHDGNSIEDNSNLDSDSHAHTTVAHARKNDNVSNIDSNKATLYEEETSSPKYALEVIHQEHHSHTEHTHEHSHTMHMVCHS
jgi:hypothetical protein